MKRKNNKNIIPTLQVVRTGICTPLTLQNNVKYKVKEIWD
jgi:hypothetical protein